MPEDQISKLIPQGKQYIISTLQDNDADAIYGKIATITEISVDQLKALPDHVLFPECFLPGKRKTLHIHI